MAWLQRERSGYLQKKDLINRIKNEIKEMISAGELRELAVGGIEEPYYSLPDATDSIGRVGTRVLILSPFDNFIIQRKKLGRFFNFDYQIECYLPEAKRKYGYFCLPIFNGTKGLGRIDCKVDRENKRIFVQSLHSEEGVELDWLKLKIRPKLKFIRQI